MYILTDRWRQVNCPKLTPLSDAQCLVCAAPATVEKKNPKLHVVKKVQTQLSEVKFLIYLHTV